MNSMGREVFKRRLHYLMQALGELSTGTQFGVRDLFGDSWGGQPDKPAIEKAFVAEVVAGTIEGVRRVGPVLTEPGRSWRASLYEKTGAVSYHPHSEAIRRLVPRLQDVANKSTDPTKS